MISYDEALRIILEASAALKPLSEAVPISEALGRVCAQDIRSPAANPSFDNSAMDGYAVRGADFQSSSDVERVRLDVVGHIAAGDMSSFAPLLSAQCYEIMTGAPIPQGCGAVIPVEKVNERASSRVSFSKRPALGDHIRRAGEDFQVGDVVLSAGTRLGCGHILTLATLGIGMVDVMSRPRVGVLSTGREIVDDLSKPLGTGQIYNATGPYLTAALGGCGARVVARASVPDNVEAFASVLRKMLAEGVQVVLSTGAVSAGAHDFVPETLREMGAEILFHKVSIKPGKPIVFARLPGGALYFGLPGNPASTAAGFQFFVRPALSVLQGCLLEAGIICTLVNSYGKDRGLRHFVRANIRHTETGQAQATIFKGQQSFMVRPFVTTNAWAVVPEGCDRLDVGDAVRVFSDVS